MRLFAIFIAVSVIVMSAVFIAVAGANNWALGGFVGDARVCF
jgi:hypothetical protein